MIIYIILTIFTCTIALFVRSEKAENEHVAMTLSAQNLSMQRARNMENYLPTNISLCIIFLEKYADINLGYNRTEILLWSFFMPPQQNGNYAVDD